VTPALIIFDCDGVLVDSERLSHAVLQQMLAEYGVELTLEQTLEHFMGTSMDRCIEVASSLIGHAVPADFRPRFRDRTFDAFTRSLTTVPGIEPVLAGLQVPYCVASNGPHQKMRHTLARTGLLPLFKGRMFSAQDVVAPKPAPDLFLHAAAVCGAPPAGCVVVEDSATGVAAARSAGMRVLGFAAMGQGDKLRRAGAHRIFDHMAYLPALLERDPKAED
jgi:HAD superfamily hydrolase (TIGR01509 family)